MCKFDNAFASLCGLLSGRLGTSNLNQFGLADWDTLLHLMDHHRVTAFCALEILNDETVHPPEHVAEKLKQALSHNVELRFRQFSALHQIEIEFGRAGIPFILQKGEAMAQRYYPEPLQRHSNDIDILVSNSLFWKAAKCLELLGFKQVRPSYPVTPAMMTMLMHKTSGMDFYRETDSVQIELHWRLLQNPRLLPWTYPEITHHCDVLEIGETKLSVMKSPAQLVYMCCHGAKHGWFRLKWLLDFRLMMEIMSKNDLSKARHLASEAGLERVLDAAIELCTVHIGCPAEMLPTTTTARNNDRLVAYPKSRIRQVPMSGRENTICMREKLGFILYYASIKKTFIFWCSVLFQYTYDIDDIRVLNKSSNWIFLYPIIGNARRILKLLNRLV